MKLATMLSTMAICVWPAAALAGPAVPEKAEVAFSDDFDAGRAEGWQGGKISTDAFVDTRGALGAEAAGMIVRRSGRFAATDETCLTFRYYVDNVYGMSVQLGNRTRGDNYKTYLCPVRRKRWTTVTFNIVADVQSAARHTTGMAAGDELDGLVIWPTERLPGARFVIDDVAVYHMGPAARAERIAADLARATKEFAPLSGWLASESSGLLKSLRDLQTPEQVARREKAAADLIARMKREHLLRRMKKAHSLRKCEYAVGVESPLVRVSSRNERMPFRGQVARAASLSAAGHEYENVQLVVIPVAKHLKQVSVSLSDLVGPAGRIDRKNLQWRLAGDVRTKGSYGYPRSLHGWKPDPLMPAAPFDVEVGQMQCVWVTAYVPPEAGPGEYSGTITVAPGNSHPVQLALNLRVWNYRIPLRGRYRHMCQFQPQSREKRRESYAFLLKYRFSPTAQYSRSPSPVAEDVKFCLDRGITTFVAGNHPGPQVNVDAVRPYYRALKEADCLDLAVIYIGDEGTSPKQLAEYRSKAETVKRSFPGLRVMVGGSTPRKELNDFVDVWDPIMSMTAGRGQGYRFNRRAVEERKALGEEVLWYMAGVRPPYPSIELDPPAVSIRMFSWVTWKYGIGGWELYGTQGGWDKATNKTWPKTPWDTYTWRTYNGSGQFVYPGPDGVPLASVRLENARDGIEDYESLALLGEAIEAVRAGKVRVSRALLAEAGKVLAVRPDVVTDMWEWTRDPGRIQAAREEVSRTVDGLVAAIGRERFDAFVARRAAARRKADNESYQKRLTAFLGSLAASKPATRPGQK